MCVQVYVRYLCGPEETLSFSHRTWLGTMLCPRKPRYDKCRDDTIHWYFAPLVGGLCLQCVDKLYPAWFAKMQEQFPNDYVTKTGHAALPMPDEVIRDFLMWDNVANIYMGERMGRYILEEGGMFLPQDIFDTACNVIKAHSIEGNQSHETIVAMTADEIGVASMEEAMERWMTIYRVHQPQMEKMFKRLKRMLFEKSKPLDLFKERIAITEMMSFELS
jgi:hypothetical protein